MINIIYVRIIFILLLLLWGAIDIDIDNKFKRVTCYHYKCRLWILDYMYPPKNCSKLQKLIIYLKYKLAKFLLWI